MQNETYPKGIGLIQIHRGWDIIRDRNDDIYGGLRMNRALGLDYASLILNHFSEVNKDGPGR